MYSSDYMTKHGYPLHNGLGPTRQNVRGEDVVIIPGERVGKIRRSSALLTDLVQQMGDKDSCLTGEDELESVQEGIISGFAVKATGLTLDHILAKREASKDPGPDAAASASSPFVVMPDDHFGWGASMPSGFEAGSSAGKPEEPTENSTPKSKAGAPGKRPPSSGAVQSPAKKKAKPEGVAESPNSSTSKAGGGGSGGPVAKAKSRPARDVCKLVEPMLSNLQRAAPEGKYFSEAVRPLSSST